MSLGRRCLEPRNVHLQPAPLGAPLAGSEVATSTRCSSTEVGECTATLARSGTRDESGILAACSCGEPAPHSATHAAHVLVSREVGTAGDAALMKPSGAPYETLRSQATHATRSRVCGSPVLAGRFSERGAVS